MGRVAGGSSGLRFTCGRLTAYWCCFTLVFLSWAASASEESEQQPPSSSPSPPPPSFPPPPPPPPPPPLPPLPSSSDKEVLENSSSGSESVFDSANEDIQKLDESVQGEDNDVQGSAEGSPSSSSSDSSFEAVPVPMGGEGSEDEKRSASPSGEDSSSSESFEAVPAPSGTDDSAGSGLSDVEALAALLLQSIGDGTVFGPLVQGLQEAAASEAAGSEQVEQDKAETHPGEEKTGADEASASPPPQQSESSAPLADLSPASTVFAGMAGLSGQPVPQEEEEEEEAEDAEEKGGREESSAVDASVVLPLGAPQEEDGFTQAPASSPEEEAAAKIPQTGEDVARSDAAKIAVPLGAPGVESASPLGAADSVGATPLGGAEGGAASLDASQKRIGTGGSEDKDEGRRGAWKVDEYIEALPSYLGYRVEDMKSLHSSLTYTGREYGSPLIKRMIHEHTKHVNLVVNVLKRSDFSKILLQNGEVVGGFRGSVDASMSQLLVHDILIIPEVIDKTKAARLMMQAIIEGAYEEGVQEVHVSCFDKDFTTSSVLAQLGFKLLVHEPERSGVPPKWGWMMFLPKQPGYFPNARFMENEEKDREREKFSPQTVARFEELSDLERHRATRFIKERVRGMDDPLQQAFLLGSEGTYAYVSSLQHDLSVLGVLGGVVEGEDVVVRFWGASEEVEDYTKALMLTRLMGDAIRDNRNHVVVKGVSEKDVSTLRVLFDLHFQVEIGEEGGLTFKWDCGQRLLNVDTILASYKLRFQEQALLACIFRHTVPAALQEAGIDFIPASFPDVLHATEIAVRGKDFAIQRHARNLYRYVGVVAVALALLLAARGLRKRSKRQEALQRLRQRIILEAAQNEEGERAVSAPVESAAPAEEVMANELTSRHQP
ncbi:hypothetical protein Emag_003713 [Eimeria magna]